MRDFSYRKILQRTSELVSVNHIEEPAWYRVMATYPPPVISPRTPQLPGVGKTSSTSKKHPRKPLHTSRPPTISYPEDGMRSAFYRLHPWELARPQTITEDEQIPTGSPQQEASQDGVNGEFWSPQKCVERQNSFVERTTMTVTEARAHVLKLYYRAQLYTSLRRRVTQEEALHNGAAYGKSLAEINFDVESSAVDEWKVGALERSRRLLQQRLSGDTEDVDTSSVALDR